MRIATQCGQCGQVDDHPKVHLGVDTKHHDCLSVSERELAVGSVQAAGSGPKLSAIIRECEGGLRGPDLLAAIQDPTALAQAEGLHEKAQAKADKEAAK